MSDSTTQPFEEFAGESIRTFALQQGKALARYSQLFTRFGEGDVDASAFGLMLAQIAVEESGRTTQNLIAWDVACWRWASLRAGVACYPGADSTTPGSAPSAAGAPANTPIG